MGLLAGSTDQIGGKAQAGTNPQHDPPAPCANDQTPQRRSENHRAAGNHHIQRKPSGHGILGKFRDDISHHHRGDSCGSNTHRKAENQQNRQRRSQSRPGIADAIQGDAQQQGGFAPDGVPQLAQNRGAGSGGHGQRQRDPGGVVIGQVHVLHHSRPQNRAETAHGTHQKCRQRIGQETLLIAL